jgi:hypothetical protein
VLQTSQSSPDILTAFSEYRSANADHRCAFFNRDLKIVTHAHRKLARAFTEVTLSLQHVSQLSQSLEVRPRAIGILKIWRESHQANEP